MGQQSLSLSQQSMSQQQSQSQNTNPNANLSLSQQQGLDPDANPFLTQRMMAPAMAPDVGRATLEQMSEMSRRAGEAGFSFDAYSGSNANAGPGGSSSSSSGNNNNNNNNAGSGSGGGGGQGQERRREERPTSRIWAAAAEAGLISGAAPNGEIPPGALRGEDVLARIEGWSTGVGAASTTGSGSGGAGQGQPEEGREEDEEVVMPTPSNNNTPPASATHQPRSWPPTEADQQQQLLQQHEGLQVYTVGHLMPRGAGGEDAGGSWSFDASALAGAGMMGGLGVVGPGRAGEEGQGQDGYGGYVEEEETVQPSPASSSGSGSGSGPASGSGSGSGSASSSTAVSTPGAQTLRVRRSTFVPGWAVPPRVLLVDDDAVSRRLSSKFLQVFGCTIDVAVDGVGAVNKMNLEKYDLVLMVGLVSFRFGEPC